MKPHQNKIVHLVKLGFVEYKKAWDFQETLFRHVISEKLKQRQNPEIQTPNYLIICEHPHVYTLGKNGHLENLLLSSEQLVEKGVSFYKINRGGDITYHGPGQLVAYPILDLDNFFTDIHKYLRYLEEIIISILKHYRLKGERYPGYTGVWLDPTNKNLARKICAIGVRCSRWVTMHGLSFNLDVNLDYFNHIIPCGIKDKAVTTLSKETNQPINRSEIEELFVKYFTKQFNCKIEEECSLFHDFKI